MGMGIKQIGDKRWYIDAVYKCGGKQWREREEFTGTERKAELRRLELYNVAKKRAMVELDAANRPIQTFGEVISKFTASQPLPETAQSTLRRVIADCSEWPIDQLRICLCGGIAPDGRTVRGYIAMLDEMPRRINKGGKIVNSSKKLSGGAKNKILGMLKRITFFAAANKLIADDPLSTYWRKSRWKEVPRNRVLREDEQLAIFNYFTDHFPEYIPLFLYSLKNPARISDLRKLTRDNLSLMERKIRYVSGKKKVPVTHIVHDDLFDYFASIPAECPWLFYRKVGEEYQPIGDFKKAWKATLIACNIAGARWHDLRHTAATWLADRLKTHEIMAIGGWKTRAMLEVYHNIDHEKTADSAIEKLLCKAQSEQQKTG